MNKDVFSDGIQKWDAYLLGQDEYGTWLYTPAGAPICNEKDEQVDTLEDEAQHFPNDKSWVASWFQDGSVVVTVTRPVEVDGCSIRYVDLGLHYWASESGHAGRDDRFRAQLGAWSSCPDGLPATDVDRSAALAHPARNVLLRTGSAMHPVTFGSILVHAVAQPVGQSG